MSCEFWWWLLFARLGSCDVEARMPVCIHLGLPHIHILMTHTQSVCVHIFRVFEFVYLYVCVRLCIDHLGLACAFYFASLLTYMYVITNIYTCLNPMNYRLGSRLRAQRFTAYKEPAPLTMEVPVFLKKGTRQLLVAFKKHAPQGPR